MLRVFLAYALSGFVALGYQVVWFRLFPDWFGSTSLSFALVVGNFIGGLGAGSLASRPFTRWLTRAAGITDTLRLYGLIELLVALAAGLTLLAGLLPADLWGHFPYHLHDRVWEQDAGYRFGQLAVAVICVSDQGPRVALIPANVTVLLPGVAPKPLPLICTCVPGGPVEGVTLVMSGLGTVNKIS